MAALNVEYEESESPSIHYYVDLLLRQRALLFTFFVVAVTFAGIYVLKLPNQYTAAAQLLFEPLEAISTPEKELTSPTYGMKDYLSTQIQILKGAPVIEEAVQNVKLAERLKMSSGRAMELAVNSLRALPVGETRIVKVSFTARDAAIAADVTNAICDSYIKKSIENRLYFSKYIPDTLPEDAKESLTGSSPLGQLSDLSNREVIEALPTVQADPTLRELKKKRTEIENELIALKKQYRDEHPSVIAKKANLKFIQESIDFETKKIVENLKAAIASRLQISTVRFIDRASVPAAPSGPKRWRILFLVALAELFISCGAVIAFDRVDDRIKGEEDVEKFLHLPYLGHLPLVSKRETIDDQEKSLYSLFKPDSELAEAVRYVRVGINFSAPPDMLRCLLLTSSLPQEGKTFTAVNLALSMAMDGNRVLLIDSDSRRPTVHSLFHLKNDVGLTNYLTSNITAEAAIQPSGVNEHLFVLTSGPSSPNPSEIYGSQRMKQLLSHARAQFDRVVIDAPPLTGIGDALVIGQLVGYVVLVIMIRKTRRDAVFAIKKRLHEAGIKVIGVILNSLDIERERYGYYRYHYRTYNRYYGKKK